MGICAKQKIRGELPGRGGAWAENWGSIGVNWRKERGTNQAENKSMGKEALGPNGAGRKT